MATPVSGAISLNHVRAELQIPSSTVSMGQYEVRALCGQMNGAISMSQLYNKRYKAEKLLGTSSVGGNNNSGGTFDLATKWGWFKNGMEITHFTCDASKYEKALYFYQFNQEWKGAGIVHYLPRPLRYTDDRRIRIPGSADWHTAYYYGYVLYPDGLNSGL